MKGTIVVCGYGPGISDAVARRFGREGFAVALVGRTAERLRTAREALEKENIRAGAFPCDVGEVDAVRSMLSAVRASFGPITVLHWNAYRMLAGDLTTAPPEELRAVFDVGVHGLVAAVKEALPDLESTKGAVLVTGGSLSRYDPGVDAVAAQWNAMGLALAKSAQHKLVGLLNKKLAERGVFVGEVTVHALVKGTAFDRGGATLEPAKVADAFWQLYSTRTDVYVEVS